MKFEIKSLWSGSVLFSLETDSMKLCVEAAVKGGAYLRDADLGGADLGYAYLGGAYLRGAYLVGAYLVGADLRGADLRGADLGYADLGYANLGGANLWGAYLGGAYLGGAKLKHGTTDLVLIGERPYIDVGPIGSRADRLCAFLTDKGVYVRTGCFWDTLDKFSEAIKVTHGTGTHADEYEAARRLILWHAHHWTPKAEAKAA